MPLLVVCLVPAAPVLLPRLTGSRVPEVAPVRAAVRRATAALAGLDRVVVLSQDVPGTLAGFGAPVARGSADGGTAAPDAPAATDGPAPSWPRELADALLDGGPHEARTPERLHRSWGPTSAGLLPELDGSSGRVGLLLLADGSRTRGPRAPGGPDARGEAVDAELVLALRRGRPARAPDAAAVGATAVEAVSLLAAAPGGPTDLLHHDAPLGVCYLVAVRRRGDG